MGSSRGAGGGWRRSFRERGARILFLHYWGVGPAAELARGVRGALDQTAISR